MVMDKDQIMSFLAAMKDRKAENLPLPSRR
jgi:hypothetical protein